MSAGDLDALASRFERMTAKAGAVLWTPGAEADAVYLVESGELAQLVLRGGRMEVVETLLPGTMVGELEMVSGRDRSCRLVVEEDAILWRLGRDGFDAMCAENPSIAVGFLRVALGFDCLRFSSSLAHQTNDRNGSNVKSNGSGLGQGGNDSDSDDGSSSSISIEDNDDIDQRLHNSSNASNHPHSQPPSDSDSSGSDSSDSDNDDEEDDDAATPRHSHQQNDSSGSDSDSDSENDAAEDRGASQTATTSTTAQSSAAASPTKKRPASSKSRGRDRKRARGDGEKPKKVRRPKNMGFARKRKARPPGSTAKAALIKKKGLGIVLER
ncbi:hypothetical protein HDU67_002818, partial [Dinochytrium kinnereticum]